MNVRDSEVMADILQKEGWVRAAPDEVPGVVILNTCHIREKAAEKIYSQLGRLRSLKARGARIGVAGCVAQAEGKEMLRRAPTIDFMLGPQSLHRLPELVAAVARGKRPIALEFAPEAKFRQPPLSPSSFVTIQEGCDKFCTFCVVPYTRGQEFCRSAQDVIRDVRAAVQKGARHITLLGQNVNAWKENSVSFGALLGRLETIKDLKWLSYTSSHPLDMDKTLIAAHGQLKKLLPALHLPVQSGSKKILKAMNRRYTAQQYLDVIKQVRHHRLDIALSGDFIVGFPGETEEDFEDTLTLVRRAQFARGYSFAFSARPGTPAAAMTPVPPAITSLRLKRLQTLLDKQQRTFNEATVGLKLPFLVEREEKDQVTGRTCYLQRAHMDKPPGRSLVGTICQIQITRAYGHSVRGVLGS